MAEITFYDNLWQAYQKEKQTNQLLLLSKTFYEDISTLINTTNPTEDIEPSVKENAARVLNEFFEKRKQKILLYVAYNKPLPQPISANELEFYNKILQILKAERIDTQRPKTPKNVLISIKEIPEILLPSGNKFGPLKKDQTVEAENEQDKIYLLENSICEQM